MENIKDVNKQKLLISFAKYFRPYPKRTQLNDKDLKTIVDNFLKGKKHYKR